METEGLLPEVARPCTLAVILKSVQCSTYSHTTLFKTYVNSVSPFTFRSSKLPISLKFYD
jgi:hypothetical protein